MNNKKTEKPALRLDDSQLRAGLRLAVGVSGGADSVALLRALAALASERGLVLHVAHLHHGLRGAEADADLEFVRELAGRLGLPFHEQRVDVAKEAARLPGKPAETIEEAARRLRYAWFRQLMGGKCRSLGFANRASAISRAQDDSFLEGVDAVATAHTLDDQAETVLAKLLRGAWTEGISGIHPVVEFPEGRVIRPLLGTRRVEVEAHLKALGQDWREDSSNRHLTFTRNRIRQELLPLLEEWNPKLHEHLAQLAELARNEEVWWEAEVERAAAGVIQTGLPVRGGGRAASEILALDVHLLAKLAVSLQRRLLRHAAGRLGFALDFAGTESLRELALSGRAGQKCEMAGGLRGERSHRELRLSIQAAGREPDALEAMEIPVPGEAESVAFGIRVQAELEGDATVTRVSALLRNWRAGDRVQLRHAGSPRKVKEVLERMKVSGSDRARWPVLEWNGRIIWMQGATVEPEPGIQITVSPLQDRTKARGGTPEIPF